MAAATASTASDCTNPICGRRHHRQPNLSIPRIESSRKSSPLSRSLFYSLHLMANLRTEILDFRGLDSSRILMLRDGILMSIGKFLEMLSQGILVGIILVGRLGVSCPCRGALPEPPPTVDGRTLSGGSVSPLRLHAD